VTRDSHNNNNNNNNNMLWTRHSVVEIVTRLRVRLSEDQIPGGRKSFYSSPEPPDRQWGSHCLLLNDAYPISLQVVKLLGRQVDRSPHLQPILGMCGAIPLRPHMPSRRKEVQLYLFDVVVAVVVLLLLFSLQRRFRGLYLL
jgi:hypothetical protein